MAEALRIVVAGAGGLVGETLFAVLARRGHDRREVRAIVPADAAGRGFDCGRRTIVGEAVETFAFARGDVVFLAVDDAAAQKLAARALAVGARVVDNSSAFRGDPAVPLVIPEVNAHELDAEPAPVLVASPNCSTTMLLVALDPLRRAFGLEHVHVATYQALSGAGRIAATALADESQRALAGEPAAATVLPVPIAFNVFPHESAVDATTLANGEEMKIVAEARRIWRLPRLRIDPFCVRVPVRRAHSQAVVVTLARPASLDECAAALRLAPGVRFVDDAAAVAPTALAATGDDLVHVGRLRHPLAELESPAAERRRVSLWLCADQLQKGAALNAVQIAERAGWL